MDLTNFLKSQLLLQSLHKQIYSSLERFLIKNSRIFLVNEHKEKLSSSETEQILGYQEE